MTRQTVTGDLIADASITTAKIVDGNITSGKLAAGAAVANIGAGGITTTQIADAAITAGKIVDGTITQTKLAAGVGGTPGDASITTVKIADNAVTSAKIASGAALANIGTGNITDTYLANGSVSSTKIVDGAVATAKLADSSVTSAKIADAAITTAKISQPVTVQGKINYSQTQLSGLAIAASGQITFNSANVVVNDQIVITGTLSGAGVGSINGYASGTVYWVTAVNAAPATSATLSLTQGGAAVTTSAGLATGLTAAYLSPYFDITGIPSWVTTVRITFKNLSTTGTNALRVHLGYGSTVETSGYLGGGLLLKAATAISGGSASSGFNIFGGTANDLIHGQITFALHEAATNTWIASGIAWDSGSTCMYVYGGVKSIASTLTRIRFGSSTPTYYYDNGEVNATYW